jgi:phosphoribosylamine--glycine ligase
LKVLLVGGGGREAALAWALARGAGHRVVRCAPGNAGIARETECVAVPAADLDALERHARAERYDLVVVGPEGPLVAGLADRMARAGLAVFGPSAAAARIEGSKVFAKEFMARHDIPTARFRVFDEARAARAHLESPATRFPVVIKADGLTGGKGVLIAADLDAARHAVDDLIDARRFGEAGARIVIEECLAGREVSFFVLCDGERFVELATCQDYKRALDGSRGPNTGGMGATSPSAFADATLRRRIVDGIVRPTVDGLAREGAPFRGVLYAGLMLAPGGPRVLEYNCRLGDPEAQVLLPRLDGDWLELFSACAAGGLGERRPRWKPGAAVCVVMASAGYPGPFAVGRRIEGLDEVETGDSLHVFHAGTALDAQGRTVTSGGRVLGVTALGPDMAAARDRAYAAVRTIRWDGEHHREDIGADAVRELAGRAGS